MSAMREVRIAINADALREGLTVAVRPREMRELPTVRAERKTERANMLPT